MYNLIWVHAVESRCRWRTCEFRFHKFNTLLLNQFISTNWPGKYLNSCTRHTNTQIADISVDYLLMHCQDKFVCVLQVHRTKRSPIVILICCPILQSKLVDSHQLLKECVWRSHVPWRNKLHLTLIRKWDVVVKQITTNYIKNQRKICANNNIKKIESLQHLNQRLIRIRNLLVVESISLGIKAQPMAHCKLVLIYILKSFVFGIGSVIL